MGKKEVDKNAEVNKKLLKAAKILERMVNQNTYNEIAQGDKIQNNFINIILYCVLSNYGDVDVCGFSMLIY